MVYMPSVVSDMVFQAQFSSSKCHTNWEEILELKKKENQKPSFFDFWMNSNQFIKL